MRRQNQSISYLKSSWQLQTVMFNTKVESLRMDIELDAVHTFIMRDNGVCTRGHAREGEEALGI